MLEKGIKAPDFVLKNQDGEDVKLSDFIGRKVVLYFYPKDNTPGCTRQACAFSTAYAEYKQKGIVVLGVSKDSVESHRKFAEKIRFAFYVAFRPRACCDKGIRRVAGKGHVREKGIWRCENYFYHRRERGYRKGYA